MQSQPTSSVRAGADSQFRNRRLRFSVLTSLFSKAATLAINFLALPLLFRALGPIEFAMYATLNVGSAWLAYANLGVGPKLITTVAAAYRAQDKEKIQTALSSAFYPIALLAALVAVSLTGYLCFGDAQHVLGPNFSGHKGLILSSGFILIATGCCQVIASVYEAVQTGYHNQGVQNLYLAAGNLISLAGLLILVHTRPSITGAIFCISVPIILARYANITVLLWKYPEIRPAWKVFNRSTSWSMFSSGLGYSLSSVGSFLNHQLPVLLLNHVLTSGQTSSAATLLTMISLAAGLVTMITVPMCASIADSIANNDLDWMRRFLSKLMAGTVAYALAISIALYLFGEQFLKIAFGKQLFVQRHTLVAVGAYLLFVLVEHVLLMTLIALHRVWNTAILYVTRGILATLIIPFAAQRMGVDGVFITLLGLTVVVTIPAYIFLLNQTSGALKKQSQQFANSLLLPEVA